MMVWWWMALALAGEPLSLEAALEAARSAPEAQIAQVEAERGRAERLETRAYTNPTVEHQGYGRVKGTPDAINGQQHQLDLGITLPVTGELLARLRRGRLAEHLGAARATTRYTLFAERVGQAWLALLAVQERERILAQATERLDALVALTERRAAEGAARRWDVDRMRLAQLTLDRQRALARQERSVAAATLAGLLGRPDEDLAVQGDLARPLQDAAGIRTDGGASPATSPFLAEAQAAETYTELAMREARRSRIPEPELRVGGYWTTDGDSSSVVASLAWSLPVFDRGQGRTAAAQAERHAAQAEARRVEAWVRAERGAVLQAIDELQRLADEPGVTEGAVLASAEVAWTEGEAGILELVDAVSAEVDQRLDAVDVALTARLLELRLATLDGALGPQIAP